MIRLRTATWNLKFHRTAERAGKLVDMYWLLDDREVDPDTADLISLGVPHGRNDIAAFVLRSLQAGQRVLQTMPLGHPLIPDEQPGFEAKHGDAPAVQEEQEDPVS